MSIQIAASGEQSAGEHHRNPKQNRGADAAHVALPMERVMAILNTAASQAVKSR